MAFLTPALPSLRRAGHRRVICAQYLPPDSLNVAFDYPSKAGNFGYVFFGEYNDRNTGQTTEIVVKCPIETPIGRQLFNMEKHTNAKLRQKSSDKSRFAEYLGEIILPADVRLTPGLARMGLVWERVGGGETLEDYLSASRVPVLANILGTSASGFPLRRELGGRVLKELAVIVENLQQCGIVHR